MDEALSVILDAGSPTFDEVVHSHLVLRTTEDLHSHLYPQTFMFRLETVASKAAVIPITQRVPILLSRLSQKTTSTATLMLIPALQSTHPWTS